MVAKHRVSKKLAAPTELDLLRAHDALHRVGKHQTKPYAELEAAFNWWVKRRAGRPILVDMAEYRPAEELWSLLEEAGRLTEGKPGLPWFPTKPGMSAAKFNVGSAK